MPNIKKAEWDALQTQLTDLKHDNGCMEAEVKAADETVRQITDIMKGLVLEHHMGSLLTWTTVEQMTPEDLRFAISQYLHNLNTQLKLNDQSMQRQTEKISDLQIQLARDIRPLKDKIIELVMLNPGAKSL
jgi:hypothetical protein